MSMCTCGHALNQHGAGSSICYERCPCVRFTPASLSESSELWPSKLFVRKVTSSHFLHFLLQAHKDSEDSVAVCWTPGDARLLASAPPMRIVLEGLTVLDPNEPPDAETWKTIHEQILSVLKL